jgi:hypothetical protein
LDDCAYAGTARRCLRKVSDRADGPIAVKHLAHAKNRHGCEKHKKERQILQVRIGAQNLVDAIERQDQHAGDEHRCDAGEDRSVSSNGTPKLFNNQPHGPLVVFPRRGVVKSG